jgi:hypothetical protein
MYSLYHSTRKNGIILAALLSFLLLSACIVDHDDDDVNDTRYSASENFSFHLDVTTQTYFELHGINGTVKIQGSANSDVVEIWGVRRVESESHADAEANLTRLTVEITTTEDGIFVFTRQPEESHGRNYIVNYQVRVPLDWMVFAENINGNTSLETIANEVSASLTNGELEVKDITGNVNAALVNGNLRLTDITGSVSGALVNGNIYGKVYLPPSGICKLSTVNGQIALSIPQATSANFSARVSNGNIALSNLSLQNATTTPTSTTGVLGGGDGTIQLQTVNGNIVVTGF